MRDFSGASDSSIYWDAGHFDADAAYALSLRFRSDGAQTGKRIAHHRNGSLGFTLATSTSGGEAYYFLTANSASEHGNGTGKGTRVFHDHDDGLWHHFCASVDASGDILAAYFDGTAMSSYIGAFGSGSDLDRITVGVRAGGFGDFDGQGGELVIWQGAELTAADVDALCDGFSPYKIQRDKLIHWSRSIGGRTTDVCLISGKSATHVSSPAAYAHEGLRSFRAGRRTILMPATASGVSLVVADIAQAQSMDAPALTQANTLAMQDMSQAQVLEAVTLTEQATLSVVDLQQAQTLESPTLSTAVILSPDPLSQTQVLEAFGLTQQNTLAVADLAQAQALDPVTLDVGTILVIADLLQSQVLDATALTQAHLLVVQGMTQAQLLSNFALIDDSAVLATPVGNIVVVSADDQVVLVMADDNTVSVH